MLGQKRLRLIVFYAAIILVVFSVLFLTDKKITRRGEFSIFSPIVNGSTQPPKKWALVIGNAAYLHHQKLNNPVNDANAFAEALKGVGFEVIRQTDLSKKGMEDCVKQFSDKVKNGGVGLFYYAGHAVQVDGSNYLVPIDSKLRKIREVPEKTINLDLIINEMRGSHINPKIVILDACRDNPLTRSINSKISGNIINDRSVAKTLLPGIKRGLAEPTFNVSDPVGIVMGFSTTPGRTASDGNGSHSPYTEALLKQINTRGLDLNQFFTLVAEDVYRLTSGDQVPWFNKSLTPQFYFKDPVKIADFEYNVGWADDRVDIYINGQIVETKMGPSGWRKVPKEAIKLGSNDLRVEVYNKNSTTGGVGLLGGNKREGWKYEVTFRSGMAWGPYKDSEDTPPDERFGSTFIVLKATIHVDAETGQISVKDIRGGRNL